MRKPFVAGNWKMNTSRADAVALAKGVAASSGEVGSVDVAVCPPFVYLSAVAEAVKGSGVAVGAQNCYFEKEGAFTGEVSPWMLKDAGCRYVILGHSERRHVFRESDKLIAKKVPAALSAELEVILCVGELLDERRADKTHEVVGRQLDSALADLSKDQMGRITIAYEPVWAIGTGETACPEEAQDVHAFIRKRLSETFGEEVAEAARIQYGGSVKPKNAAGLMRQPDVDGALVGGASLEADSFAAIVKAGAEAKAG